MSGSDNGRALFSLRQVYVHELNFLVLIILDTETNVKSLNVILGKKLQHSSLFVFIYYILFWTLRPLYCILSATIPFLYYDLQNPVW